MVADRPVRFPGLGSTLQEARKQLGVSGNELSRRLGWSQSKVSRIEAGITAPSVEDVRQWAEKTGAQESVLLAKRDAAMTGQFDLMAAARGEHGHIIKLQEHLAELEAASTTLFEFQPRMIPGPLQTKGYAKAWLTHHGRVSWVDKTGADEIAEQREQRRQRLRDAGVQITVCVERTALVEDYGDPAALDAQRSLLTEATRDGWARVLVLNEAAPVLHGFELLDDALLVESEFGLAVYSAPERVEAWRRLARRLEANSSAFV